MIASVTSRKCVPCGSGRFWGSVAACCLLACLHACLTSQQQASVSQGRICSENCTCCHTEIHVLDQTCYVTHSKLTSRNCLFVGWSLSVPATCKCISGTDLFRFRRQPWGGCRIVCLLVGRLASQQHASVSQGQICFGFDGSLGEAAELFVCWCWLLNVPATG